jgi:allantoinase
MLIRGATVFGAHGPRKADVRVEGERVAEVGDGLGPDGDEIDAAGLWLLPGGIDAHVHSRDPGFSAKEDFGSLTAAAAAGGITTVVDMPNTLPAVDSAAVFQEKLEQVTGRARVDFGLWGVARSSATEADLEGLLDAGAVGIKAYLGYAVRRAVGQVVYTLDLGDPDLEPPPDYGTLARIAPLLARRGAPLAVHAEDPGILREFSRRLETYQDVLASRPSVAEAVAVAALGVISRASGCSIHVVHLSSAAGLLAANAARAAGAHLELETCAQYLWCTDEDMAGLGPVAKMFPPIRTADDRDALREGLRDGEIGRVATDHAPHEDAEKLGRSWEDAAAGSPGVETLYLSCLELTRVMQLPAASAVRWVADSPARALGLYPRKGVLQAGADADLVLVDPNGETVASADRLHSRQRHGVFDGRRFGFRVHSVWSRGELVARDAEPIAPSGRGRLVRPEPS